MQIARLLYKLICGKLIACTEPLRYPLPLGGDFWVGLPLDDV